MTGCFAWLLFAAGGVFVLASLLRWFEQTAEAVDQGWWNKLLILIVVPFSVWFFPSKVSAGRPTAVPRHEPVRGFGKVSLTPTEPTPHEPAPPPLQQDGPPPGTPAEFIGMPVIPPKKARTPVDSDKLAKLRQKMMEQGMLGNDETRNQKSE